ncbi:MAG: hypothetical protein OSA78_00020 [Flavobacteriales bacterium]|nr:hypothetical protein [Flavobacteriales bacterium]
MIIKIGCFFVMLVGMVCADEAVAQNIIPDPGFEAVEGPFCGIMGPNDFSNTLFNWASPTYGTPQMFFTNADVSCYNTQPVSTYSGPIGIRGNQLPLEGQAMAGLYAYTIEGFNQRHYVQAELEEPLVPGQAYAVGFYVSLADYIEFASTGLQALLTAGPVNLNSDEVIDAQPQVSSEEMVDDAVGWTLIVDTLTFEGPVDFITIGNFKTDEQTLLVPNPTFSGAVGTYGAFYFLDEVFIEEVVTSNLQEVENQNEVKFLSTSQGLEVVSSDFKTGRLHVELFGLDGRQVFESSSRSSRMLVPWTAWSGDCAIVSVRLDSHVTSQVICRGEFR